MADQQLSLKITGDSDQAVSAVSDIGLAVKTVMDQLGEAAATVSSAASAGVDDLASIMTSMSGMVEQPFAAMAQAADSSSQDTRNSVQVMFDEILNSAHHAVSAAGESFKELGEKIEHGFSDPIGHVKSELNSLLQEMGPVGVGIAAIGATVAAAATGLYELAKGASETGESVLAFSRVTGTAVEEVGAIKAAAEIGGSSLEQSAVDVDADDPPSRRDRPGRRKNEQRVEGYQHQRGRIPQRGSNRADRDAV
jgi:methyl-accepting chemotaxis protein